MNGDTMANNLIPKIIHIMWIGSRQPPQECIDSWWKMHPDWIHMFWDDAKVAEFKFQNQHAIDQSQFISGKVNIMRYEILKHYGGVFIDADALCLKPLDDGDFLGKRAFSCYINENLSLRVANGYMGFIKNYPLLDELIERISNLPDSEFNPKRNNSWLITGPEFLRKTIEETADLIHLYPSVTFCPVHHSGVRAENWKEAEIYSLQYWNSTHRTDGSIDKRKILDDALAEFLSDLQNLNSE
jgi:mannosyltransferase OCH1-like enzyme